MHQQSWQHKLSAQFVNDDMPLGVYQYQIPTLNDSTAFPNTLLFCPKITFSLLGNIFGAHVLRGELGPLVAYSQTKI
jgi:hypothetical protein